MRHAERTTEQMYPLEERYLQGHQTQKAFCLEHGLSTSVLNYWLAKYRRETTRAAARERGAFVEFTPPQAGSEQLWLEVVYPQGVRLRLFAPIEPAYLARLLALASRPPGRNGGRYILGVPHAEGVQLFDYSAITDVLITFEYTALNSFDYHQQIIRELDRSVSADRPFSFRQEFADQWYDLHNPEQIATPMAVRFQTRREDFPPNMEDLRIRQVLLYFARADATTF